MKKKIIINLLLILSIIGLIECKKKEEKYESENTVRVLNGFLFKDRIKNDYTLSTYYDSIQYAIPNAKIEIYDDYQSSITNTIFSDGIGRTSFKVEHKAGSPQPVHIYVSKDSLNSERYPDVAQIFEATTRYVKFQYVAVLTPSKTKLQLTVFNNGVPVEDATVKLFWSEQDYLSNTPPSDQNALLYQSVYGLVSYKTLYDKYYSPIDPPLYGETDKDGIVLFDNLEPRQYWFRIVKNSLTNNSTTFNTNGKLKGSEITNALSVGVN